VKQGLGEEDEVELIGYITLIEPRVYRGFMEYRVKVTPPGAKSESVYIREPPTWMRLGIPVRVKAVKSRQTREHRYIVEEIKPMKNLPTVKPVEVILEEILSEKVTIISGRKQGRLFSVSLKDEKLLSKLPNTLPAHIYCLFLEAGGEIRVESILTQREHDIILKTFQIARKLENLEKGNSLTEISWPF